MKILVCGATGVIGIRVVRDLLAGGHDVTAISRPNSPRVKHARRDIRWIEASLFDEDSLKNACDGQQVVINLATKIPSSSASMLLPWAWRETNRIRTVGAQNLANAAIGCGAERMIQESFAYGYPDSGARWISEDTGLAPASYCRGILGAEDAARSFGKSGGIAVALRFAAFYGGDARHMKSMLSIAKRGWASLPGPADAYVSSISHDDAAAAVIAALDAPPGPYNVVDDEPVTHREYLGIIADSTNAPKPRFPPACTTVLMGPIAMTLARSLRISNDLLRTKTGWSPSAPSVKTGLPKAVKELENGTQ